MMTSGRDLLSTARSGIPFVKMLSRETASPKPKKLINDHAYDTLPSQRKIIAPNFNHFKARYRKGQKLPSYMENVNNRMTITKLSYEMLKANNYYAEPIDDLKNYNSFITSRNHSTRYPKESLFITSSHNN
jgi:hypothetical protein